MGIYWKHIDPQLEILGNLQQINYSTLQNLSKFQFNNTFVPTPLIPAKHFFEFRNNGLSGFRFYHTTNSGDTHGSLALQSFVNAEDTGVDIFKFLQDGTVNFVSPVSFDDFTVTGDFDMAGHRIINAADPVDPQDLATKAYVLSAVGSSTITLTGAVTGTSSTGTIATTLTPITTSKISNFNSAVKGFRLDEFVPPFSDLSINGFRILDVASPQLGTDGVNRNYVDNKTISVSGAISGAGLIGGDIFTVLEPITTSQISNFNTAVPAFRLDQFAAPTSDVSFGSQRITNVATPSVGTDGANRSYVDAKTITLTGAVTGTGALGSIATTLTAITTSQISNFNASVTAFRLDQFAAPTASVNLGNQKITNLLAPALGTDATNKTYVDNAVAASLTITLTGAVTGTGNGTISTFLVPFNTSKITDFATAVTAFRLDQFAAPNADINMNSRRIINLIGPSATNDAANKFYVDNAIAAASTITLTGAVTGAGTGTVPNVLSSVITTQSSTQSFVFNDLLPKFLLKNNIVLTAGQTSFAYLDFRNSYSYGYSFYNSTPYDSTSHTGGTFGLILNSFDGVTDVFKFSMGGPFGSAQLTLAYQVGIGVAPTCPLDFGIQNNNFPNKTISLYSTNTNDHQFFGFGMDDSSGLEMRAQIDGSTNSLFSWNGGVNNISSRSLMRLTANGNLTIGLNEVSQSARLTIVGGVQTIINEDTCINLFGNSAATKIEVQNTRKHEIRSQSDGSFVIYDRTGGGARQTINSAGATSFSGDMTIGGAYYGKRLTALLTTQGNTTGFSVGANSYVTLQGTFTGQYLYLFTQSLGTSLTYNGPSTKMDITLHTVCSYNNALAATVSIAIFKNNVRVPYSTMSSYIPSGNFININTSTAIDLVPGDVISVSGAATSSGVITVRDFILKASLC